MIHWYLSGLRFSCNRCGKCCAGPVPGYIWVTDQEITAIAGFLGLTADVVLDRHTEQYGQRRTIIETPNNACPFLIGGNCAIYEARPTQCRTWPWWDQNLASPETWEKAKERCPGIGVGELHSFHEIDAKRTQREM